MCLAVGEEDEVSIKEAAESIVTAMDFKGEVIVSFLVFCAMKGVCWGVGYEGEEGRLGVTGDRGKEG